MGDGHWHTLDHLAFSQDHGFTSEQSAHALNTHKSVGVALHFLVHSTHQPGEFSWSKVTFSLLLYQCKTHFHEHHLSCSFSQPELRPSTWSQSKQPPPPVSSVHKKREIAVPSILTFSILSTGRFIPSGWGTCCVQCLRARWNSCLTSKTTLTEQRRRIVRFVRRHRCPCLLRVGPVRSVRLLTYKRCAFVNFTKREDCEQAIKRFHVSSFETWALLWSAALLKATFLKRASISTVQRLLWGIPTGFLQAWEYPDLPSRLMTGKRTPRGELFGVLLMSCCSQLKVNFELNGDCQCSLTCRVPSSTLLKHTEGTRRVDLELSVCPDHPELLEQQAPVISVTFLSC